MEHVRVDIVRLALNLVCPTSIVSDAANHSANVTLGHCDGLAVVERLDSRQQICILLQEIGELQQHTASLIRSCLFPGAVESLAGGCHGNIDILLCGLVDLSDDLLG